MKMGHCTNSVIKFKAFRERQDLFCPISKSRRIRRAKKLGITDITYKVVAPSFL